MRSKDIGILPISLTIHIYSAEEIAKAAGMEKDYRLVWNSEAMKVCRSEDATTQKEIEGAINISWTLQLKVEELYVKKSITYLPR